MNSEITESKPVRIPPEYIQYAEKHSIYKMMERLLKLLILDRPEDPISYLIKYLEKDIEDVPSIFIFGPKPSGKTFLGSMLSERLQCVMISDNDLFSLCSRGKNASLQELTTALTRRLKEPDCESKGYIIVGFPRYENEAKALIHEGVFPEYANSPLVTLVERASGEKVDPETGDLYNLIYNPPPDTSVERRLLKIPENDEETIRKLYSEYSREVVLLKKIYRSVAYEFDADQPISDLYSFVLARVNQRHRSAELMTPKIILLGYPGAVPDAIIAEAVKQRLNETDCTTYGWILYGYPRTRQQAELLSSHKLEPTRVIFLDINQSCAFERLSGRRIDPVSGTSFHILCESAEDVSLSQRGLQNPNDKECVIGPKLSRFTTHRDDIIDYYDSCVIRVHADRDIHTVFEEIESAIDQIEIHTRKRDPNLIKYTRKHHLYEVFEALLGGLSVMLPTNPRRWIAEKLQLLYDIGFISLNWDTFIDPDMKPTHPYVDHELMHSLFGTSKLEFLLPEELQYQPTPEMIAKAYAAQKQSILKKCLSAWKLYFIVKRARTTHICKINFIAEMMRKLAQSLITQIKEFTMTMLYFKAWRKNVAEAQKTRSYFLKMLSGAQDSGERSEDSESESQLLTLGGKISATENYRDRLAELPDTVQYKVFRYLTPIDLARAACVSQYWWSVVNEMDKNNTLDLTCFEKRLSDEILLKLTRNRRDDAVRLITAGCSLLLYLNLSYTQITDHAVHHLATSTKMLQYLSLAYCVRLTQLCSTFFNQLESFKSLVYLDLSGCIHIGSFGLQTIIKSVPQVEHWLLNDISWISDGDLMVLASCPIIQTIEIVGNQNAAELDSNYISKLHLHHEKSTPVTATVQMKNKESRPITCTVLISKHIDSYLNNLCPNSGDRITDSSIRSICGKNLKRFLVSNIKSFDGSGLDNIIPSYNLPRLHSKDKTHRLSRSNSDVSEHGSFYLREVSIVDCPKLTDILLQNLLPLPHLTVLNLSGCESLTDQAVKLLTDGLYAEHLIELYMARCSKLTDKSIHAMSVRLFNLAYLSLASCPLISDGAFELLSQLPKLWQINLSATKLGDRGLSALGSLPKLRELKVAKCTDITDVGLQKFAHLGINIEYIDLSFCHNLTNNGIKTLAFCCHFLVSIKLAGCSLLTDMTVQYISGVCHYLKFLDLSGCELITEASLSHLRKGCKKLEHLRLLYCRSISKRKLIRLTTGKINTIEHSTDEPPSEFSGHSIKENV
ncbi:Adenylate kinase 8 [Schistosoma japonicum]|nr:Adenylate kinase 8 [Schistosoma japonicum]